MFFRAVMGSVTITVRVDVCGLLMHKAYCLQLVTVPNIAHALLYR